MDKNKFKCKSFDWDKFKKYVISYDPEQHAMNDPDIIFNDMLYGLGIAVKPEKFKYLNGLKMFKEWLVERFKITDKININE